MFRVTRVLRADVVAQAKSAVNQASAAMSKQGGSGGKDQVLQKGARKDPELYVCLHMQDNFKSDY